MDALLMTIRSVPLLIIAVIIEYRLLRRTLQQGYSGILTVSAILAVKFLAGWFNLYTHLAQDIGWNALYHGTITILLYSLLFKGTFVKKLFLAALITCGLPMLFYIFLPTINYFFKQATPQRINLALNLFEYIHILLSALCMEYVGKKFQNLRRELPFDYTLYLTAVIVFVYIAIYSAYDYMLVVNEGSLSLFAMLTSIVFAIGGVAIVVVAIFALDRQVDVSLKEQLSLMQLESLKSRELEWRRFSGFRHDIKNHLICLEGLLQGEKTQQAALYMQNLTDTVRQFDSPVQTGNDYADALLSVKYAQAVTSGIDISIEMAIPATGYIEPVDLCCILSNAFDNAIAACNHLTCGDRWIKARSFIKQGQLVIEIKNSKPYYVTVVNGEVSPKEITADHGLGLDNVKAVVEKYGGILRLSADNEFSFGVLLPVIHL